MKKDNCGDCCRDESKGRVHYVWKTCPCDCHDQQQRMLEDHTAAETLNFHVIQCYFCMRVLFINGIPTAHADHNPRKCDASKVIHTTCNMNTPPFTDLT